jgi:hypothetical protein
MRDFTCQGGIFFIENYEFTLLLYLRKTSEIVKPKRKKWGNLDLNQGPAGYEGGGPPYNPVPSNRYEYDGKGLKAKILLEFIGF